MNKDKIKEIFCEVLDVSEAEVTNETSYESFAPWDSLKHLELISRFEEEFGVEIKMDDIIAMETFGKIIELLQEYPPKAA